MNADATLTKREAQIAELIAWGAAKKEIAVRLFISERTVENTARSIYDKTGVSKSNELAAWWFCTNFKIPFSLSPLKRQIAALTLLLLIATNEISNGPAVLRTYKARTRTETRTRTRRNNDDCYDYLPEL
jgi:DNA-binding CsgD family transcriptional regulator